MEQLNKLRINKKTWNYEVKIIEKIYEKYLIYISKFVEQMVVVNYQFLW